MNETLQDLMRAATGLTRAGRLTDATETIKRALKGPVGTAATPRLANAGAAGAASGARRTVTSPPILNGGVVVGDARAPAPGDGEFIRGTHTHATLTRGYKLYVPPGRKGRRPPLVVMLHGCTQDPDDFAAGTDMNERAYEQGFFVLYPEQSRDANPSRCWNWFKHNHQQRGSGEPALLASMTREVMKQHDIDPRRVYIAGLSAGGAMAAIVAEAYPEIFAAVGVHSGLPRGAASSVTEALSVMNSGVASAGLHAGAGRAGMQPAVPLSPQVPVPTIVFHGDQDRTVHPRNGEQVIAAVLGSAADESRASNRSSPRVEQGVSSQGRRYTRSTHHGKTGDPLAEHWLVHGAGHAWSGGRAQGSYTDAHGPDATQEMLRFFFAHPHGLQH